METKEDVVPAWFREETPIEIRDDISFSAFSSDGEFGIMPAAAEADIEVKVDEAAFLFGKDKDELLFMPQFGLFFKVLFNSSEKTVASRLYEQQVGVYRSLSLTKDEHFTVPVYRDSLSMISHEPSEGNAPNNGDEGVSSQSPNIQNPFHKDEEEEKQVEKFVEQTLPFDEEIETAVDAEIERQGGCVYSRFRPGNNRLYSFDIAQIGKRLYSIVYADFAGDWLSDEDSFAGDPPLWFSESSHRVSPVHQAIRCRDFFSKELPNIKIASIVVLPEKCVIINDEDMLGCWREKCGTAVVRTKRIDETTLQSLHEYVAAQPPDANVEVSELDIVEVIGMSNRYTMNPENWINKD